MEFLHIPCAVDLEVRSEFQDAAVRDEERAALHRKEDEGPFVGIEVRAEQGQSIGIALCAAGCAEECDVIERVRILHFGGRTSHER